MTRPCTSIRQKSRRSLFSIVHEGSKGTLPHGTPCHRWRARGRARPNQESEMSDPQREIWSSDALLLTPEEAARVLRVGRTTVYALLKAGDLHPVHIGRSCRLSRAELERYVNQLEARPP